MDEIDCFGQENPGVVNTDAHYNFHGSGAAHWIRCSTDDPASFNRGNDQSITNRAGVMSTGPFMRVSLSDPALRVDAQIGDTVSLSAPEATLNVEFNVQTGWMLIASKSSSMGNRNPNYRVGDPHI